MRLKLVLIAFCAIFWCVACNEEDVDTSYGLRMSELVVSVNGSADNDTEVMEKFSAFMVENEYLIDFQFTGESRKENNDKATARFEEKYKSLQLIDLAKILSLPEGQSVTIKFVYSLTRGDEQIGESKQVELTASVTES